MNRKMIFVFILLLAFIMLVNGKGFYIVVAPDTIQSNNEYSVTVTLPGNTEPTSVEVNITGPSFNSTQTLVMPEYNSAIARFDVPKLTNGTYNLKVQSVKGFEFANSTNLKVTTTETESLEDMTKVAELKVTQPTNVTTKRFGPLNLKVKKKVYRIARDIIIKVNATEPIPYLIYNIVVKGNILMHQYLELTGYETKEYITITPQSDMIPKANIFVYHILNDTLMWEDFTLHIAQKSDCDQNNTEFHRLANNYDNGEDTVRKPPGEVSGLVTLTNVNYALEREKTTLIDARWLINRGKYFVAIITPPDWDYVTTVTLTCHTRYILKYLIQTE